MTHIVDTNVVIGLIDPDDRLYDWANEQVALRKLDGPLLIVDIVYAEWSYGMDSKHEIDTVIADYGFDRFSCSDDALFRAGKAFKAHKDRGGQKKRVLPEMIIGAIAEIAGIPLITANAKDFKRDFPTVNVIQPPKALRED